MQIMFRAKSSKEKKDLVKEGLEFLLIIYLIYFFQKKQGTS